MEQSKRQHLVRAAGSHLVEAPERQRRGPALSRNVQQCLDRHFPSIKVITLPFCKMHLVLSD